MKRILVITNMYPPHHLGGYELSCRDVVNRWRAMGHAVTVLTSDLKTDGATRPEDEAGVRRDLSF
ncbi:MAG: glycosyltransferase family 4 protein, partial [Actinomycetota bacterium]